MAYSQKYYDHLAKIERYQNELRDLDSDYAILQECKQKLAESSALFGDLLTQCSDITKIFDRGTIEGRYDSCQITFNNKDFVFEYLDNIVSSTNSFDTSCGDIKDQIDKFGATLDNCCIEIAQKAKVVSDTINSLMAQSVYLMEPEPPK